jgi:integrase
LHLKPDLIVLNESKGTKGAIASQRFKVLKKTKQDLLALAETRQELQRIYLCPEKEIEQLIPDHMKARFEKDLAIAIKKAKPKKRECEIPHGLFLELKKHQRKHKKIDDGYIFSSKTFPYHKNKTTPITRQAVWGVFKKISDALQFDFNTACHQLRKTFAVFLYQDSGNDSALVIKEIGWTDDSILQTYLSVDEQKRKTAVKNMHENYL